MAGFLVTATMWKNISMHGGGLKTGPRFALVGAWFMALTSARYPAPQAAKLSSPLGADCSNLAAASMEHGI
ncbi:MAG TPA: hypothetical protein EYM65_02210 [Dehalococcoidia bacterium]|nr:hypothetical protein [Dehalococcoidia bacterium]